MAPTRASSGPAPAAAAAAAAAAALTRWPTTWPWWLQVIAVFGATRVWSTAVFLVAAAAQPVSYWAPAGPDYPTFVGVFWDGSWYRTIAEQGYPATLPRGPDGTVQQSAWAFFPLFPLLVRGVMAVTGGSWAVLAPSSALVLGCVAALVLDRLVQRQVEARQGPGKARRLALGTVLLVGCFPAAPALQVAYAESLALLLVALALWFLVRRSYTAAVPVVLALGFTRPVALPMAAVVAVHLGLRWRDHRAGRERLGTGDVVQIIGLALAAGVAGVAWPAVVGWVTGVPDAYVLTQSAWRGTFSSAPVVPWVQMSQYLMGAAGPVVLVLAVVAVGGLALSRAAGAAGTEVQAWGVAYVGYLLLVALPQSSLVRLLLLAFPLALATAGIARTRGRLLVVAGILAAGQVGWVVWLWQLTAPTSWPP